MLLPRSNLPDAESPTEGNTEKGSTKPDVRNEARAGAGPLGGVVFHRMVEGRGERICGRARRESGPKGEEALMDPSNSLVEPREH